jgi:hypothetical protein
MLADEAAGYEWHSEVFGGTLGRTGDVGLWPAMQGCRDDGRPAAGAGGVPAPRRVVLLVDCRLHTDVGVRDDRGWSSVWCHIRS